MKHTKFGRYELLHKVAAGGMAEIYLGRQWGQAGFFRDVIIKRLFPYFAENAQVLRMFQDEARLLAELYHPNIPQVYDLGETGGYWYIAMEHVGGFRLVDICQAAAKQAKPMPLAVSLGIVSQICAALHHAHERTDREGRPLRIVHCDVTPHNIMVTLDGVVKVFDFGVAQTAVRTDDEVGFVRGTYAYMAPEQVKAKALDKRADVFGVGVILYELTTGRRLFQGNDVQIMTAIVEKDVAPPSSFIQGYPRELDTILLSALSRDRSRRTASARHVMMSLEQFAVRNSFVLASGAIAKYMRALFPYQRAREAGMGLVQSFSEDSERPPELGVEEFEEKLLLEELRRLKEATPAVESYVDEIPQPLNLPKSSMRSNGSATLGGQLPNHNGIGSIETELEERKAQVKAQSDRLGLDRFDEDSDLKPIVVLTPKTKPPYKNKASQGNFMSNLARRLQKDTKSQSDK